MNGMESMRRQLNEVSIPHWFDSSIALIDAPLQNRQFQFHIGSIQAICTCRQQVALLVFQFHIGSIQARTVRGIREASRQFQFHIGSIQARCLALIPRLQGGFNSTLVRFKPTRPPIPRAAISCFNSTLVRFKPSTVFDALLTWHGFNSTLVRFKLAPSNALAVPFSFVSIPHWFDSSTIRAALYLSSIRFQFHIGSIQAYLVTPQATE